MGTFRFTPDRALICYSPAGRASGSARFWSVHWQTHRFKPPRKESGHHGRRGVQHGGPRRIDRSCAKAGTATGRALGQIVGSNLAAYTAELGGKAPIVVFDDADLESAVNGAAFASFVASGQTCVSGTRLIVQEGIYGDFMERFLAKVESIRKRMGDRTLVPLPLIPVF